MWPTGEQHEIAAAGHRAVVTESGATLRLLEHEGRALIDGFGAGEMSAGCRGQLLVPWCNRVRDGRYSFGGRDLQLPLSEPDRGNASHGLVRWAAWTLLEHTGDAVALGHRLMPQPGYPWALELEVRYELSGAGLVVTQSATNRGDSAAPYASGAHPYLSAGPGPVDGWEVSVGARTRVLTDDRLLPVGTAPVAGTPFDLRRARLTGDLRLDDAFTDLDRDADGRTWVHLRGEHTVSLWADARHGWLQLFTADDVGEASRRSLAVEPMTAPADAFRSGQGLTVLAPGERFEASWGVTAGD
jgi:aldose 1-epimerase